MLKLLLPPNSKPKKGGVHCANTKGSVKKLKIYRYGGTGNPVIHQYEVENSKGKTVLQALDEIKENYDQSLAYRKSCREGACGSCSMNINKQNGLACTTKLEDIKGEVEVYPLPHLRVIKDLICDMSTFFKQYESIKPWLVEKVKNKAATEGENNQKERQTTARENLQTTEEREALNGLYECILCACCSTNCPSYWWNETKFIGPAAALQTLRFVQDSRDGATEERLQRIKEEGGIENCHKIFTCTSVCPKNLNPANAIAKLKSMF